MSSRVLASACDASVITASARLPLGVRTETKIFSAAPSVLLGRLPRGDPQRLIEHRIHMRRRHQPDPQFRGPGHGELGIAGGERDRLVLLGAGQPLTAAAREAMARFRAEHPRGRYGGVRYNAEDLDLDAEDVGRRLAAYRERFVGSAP